ncbi:MAG: hypothetical protein EAZ37_03155 [Burkholderiales bacterium]|nr:MAG: hypothetical protein EAZ37_03155 [Burkholderiales bacterium]
MKHFVICILTLFLNGFTFAQANLAYSEEFVWHLAGRLSTKLYRDSTSKLQGTSVGEQADIRMQFEILYRNYLISCDGPLPLIAKKLRSYPYPLEQASNLATPLEYVGKMDYEIWVILEEWEPKVRATLLADLGTGAYGFSPACTHENYLNQNPKLRVKN